MSAVEQYLSYSAPRANGQTLSVPAWHTVGDLLITNREYRASQSADIHGRSLVQLAGQARQAALAEALAYTQSYANVDIKFTGSDFANSPLVLTGHQPELVHPGVWLKDFAAAKLASQAGGTAISLIIDSDLCRVPAIRVPTGTAREPRVESVAYDRMISQMPWEERPRIDPSLWNSFGSRVSQAIKPLVPSPLIAEWWPEHALRSDSTQLGLAVAQARHRLQLAWGVQSLCLPQSRICQTTPFRWFAAHLLSNASRFRSDYNGALAQYRRVHRLTNHAQPTPDLAEADGWVETPFWIWTSENPRRRGLFVQQKREELLLTDRDGFAKSLPLTSESETMPALEQLAAWESHGIKLRTRALITTMYSRLALADLFIHGIGGAKYDQVTDAICERFFGFSGAPFVTLSGTLRLPIEHPSISPSKEQQLRQLLRELVYHPESEAAKLTLSGDVRAEVDALIAEKLSWVRVLKTPANASERHQRIVAANEALQGWLVSRRAEIQRNLAETTRQIRANQVLESREYPFCLFPQDPLRKFLLDFSAPMP